MHLPWLPSVYTRRVANFAVREHVLGRSHDGVEGSRSAGSHPGSPDRPWCCAALVWCCCCCCCRCRCVARWCCAAHRPTRVARLCARLCVVSVTRCAPVRRPVAAMHQRGIGTQHGNDDKIQSERSPSHSTASAISCVASCRTVVGGQAKNGPFSAGRAETSFARCRRGTALWRSAPSRCGCCAVGPPRWCSSRRAAPSWRGGSTRWRRTFLLHSGHGDRTCSQLETLSPKNDSAALYNGRSSRPVAKAKKYKRTSRSLHGPGRRASDERGTFP